MSYSVKVQRVPYGGDLYIDIPVNMFEEMGWDSNTKLMWVIAGNGDVTIRPPKHDDEPGIPVEFVDLKKDSDKNDSGS